jgi:hypothetical protein
MSCQKCLEVPNSHSFDLIGMIDDINIYYTAPAKALEYKETPENFENFKKHLNETKGKKWIWVFDCYGMQLKHCKSITYMKNLTTVLANDHYDFLQGVWFIRQNTWIKAGISILKTLFKAGLVKKMRVFKGDKLELYMQLEKGGLTGPALKTMGGILNQDN